MGIDLQIVYQILAPSQKGVGLTARGNQRPDVKSLEIAASAWEKTRTIDEPCAFIEDHLIFFRKLNKDNLFTLYDLFANFWRNIASTLCNANSTCQYYIMICDDRDNVPQEKQATQQSRANASKKSDLKKCIAPSIRYPIVPGTEWNLVDNGITYQSQSDDGSMVEEIEKIDLQRLRLMDPSQKRLWRAFIPLIVEALQEKPLQEGRTLIFDFDNQSGAIWFTANGIMNTSRIEPQHNLGEGELSMSWWLSQSTHPDCILSNLPIQPIVYLRTSDTDILPILMLQYDANDNGIISLPTHIYWRPDDKKGKMVNMKVMAELIKKEMPLNVFALFCIFCANNDYMSAETKASYANRVGVTKIYCAVKSSMNEIEETMHKKFSSFLDSLHGASKVVSSNIINEAAHKARFTYNLWMSGPTANKQRDYDIVHVSNQPM